MVGGGEGEGVEYRGFVSVDAETRDVGEDVDFASGLDDAVHGRVANRGVVSERPRDCVFDIVDAMEQWVVGKQKKKR